MAHRAVGEVPPDLSALGVTQREAEVLTLLCEQLTNREIAERLTISPRRPGSCRPGTPARHRPVNLLADALIHPLDITVPASRGTPTPPPRDRCSTSS